MTAIVITNLIIGGILTLVMIVSILALIGWVKNKGRYSLPLTYRMSNRWYHELVRIPTTIFYTWGNNYLDVDWTNWELGVGRVNHYPNKRIPVMGDYILVLGKWNQVIVLVVNNFNPTTHQIETCALGYLDEQKSTRS